MINKEKKFPLTLASVVEQKNAGTRGSQTVMNQTAMKNAAKEADAKVRAKVPNPARLDAGNWISASAPKSQNAGNYPEMKKLEASSKSQQPLVSLKVRQAMVTRVAQQGVTDSTVLSSLEAIPRELFIDSGLSSQAYVEASLPIGHHQTISKPYIVARMIEIMRNGKKLGKVMEIGTGCGYQAAVLSLVAQEVYSIERIKALHELAKENLRPMRIANIRLHYGDGMLGLPQIGPFDGIILAAAGMEVPPALLQQLVVGGRLIAPVGGKNQVLQLIERLSVNEWRSEVVEQCHFVPLHQGVI